jgi:NAD(P)-dependent dehydrogenase (short-subunit alcohol dehydrogenase family)
MQNSLAKRVALVTGASRGIGYATAMALAKRGAHVVATARSKDGLADLEKAIKADGGSVTVVALDMTEADGIARLAAMLKERFGKLDILVGNAAMPGPSLKVETVEPEAWDETVATNLTANFHLIRLMHPLLEKSDAGRLVFMSSSAVRQARAVRGIYAATKAGLESLVRAYAEGHHDTPLRANLFNPGPIRTAMRAAVAPHEDPMALDTPEQCAEKLVELCLPGYQETGKLYDYAARGYIDFVKPSVVAWDARK